MAGPCGSCTMCCNLFPIPELQKPAHTWCSSCKPGVGCQRYETRPPPCHDFMCLWLQGSLNLEKSPPPDWMRPDRSKVMLFTVPHDPLMLNVMPHKMHPDAWRDPRILHFLKNLVIDGWKVLVSYGPTTKKHIFVANRFPSGRVKDVTIRVIHMSEVDENGEQFYLGDDGHAADDYAGVRTRDDLRAAPFIPPTLPPAPSR